MFGEASLDAAIGAEQALHNLVRGPKDSEADTCRVKTSDVDLLRRAGMSEDDIAHSIQVAQKALELAERTGAELDVALVGRGALLHDLGKAETRGFDHGIAGAAIGRKLGLAKEITTIMEKHVHAGLTSEEARELGLPEKGYALSTLEEKIVVYADKLIDIISASDRIVSTEREAEQRFAEILKAYPKLAKGEKALHRHLQNHKGIQRLINAHLTIEESSDDDKIRQDNSR